MCGLIGPFPGVSSVCSGGIPWSSARRRRRTSRGNIMSEPTASDPPNGAGPPVDDGVMLQFDQAEFATPQAERPACAICKLPIAEEYFEIGGEVLCPMCRHGVEASFRGGSPAARFFTALAFGLTAAAIGAVID